MKEQIKRRINRFPPPFKELFVKHSFILDYPFIQDFLAGRAKSKKYMKDLEDFKEEFLGRISRDEFTLLKSLPSLAGDYQHLQEEYDVDNPPINSPKSFLEFLK